MHGRRLRFVRLDRNRLTWTVWGAFFAGTVLLLAWQFGLFSMGYEPAESGRLVDADAADASKEGELPELEPPQNQSEPIVTIAAPEEVDFRDGHPPLHDFEPHFPADRSLRSADDRAMPAHFVREAGKREVARPVAGERPYERSRPGVWRNADELADAGLLPPRAETDRPAQTSRLADHPDLAGIDRLIAAGDHVAAQKQLTEIYWSRPDFRPQIRERIESNAGAIFFAAEPHLIEPYTVQPGDMLSRIGRQYDVPWEYLVRLNRVDPRRIRPGKKLKVVRGPFHATVDLSDFELTVHTSDMFAKRYQVGIGRDGSTPRGRFTVLGKVKYPQYTDPVTREVIDGHDPANPLGDRWIDLGDSYGIHGTIEPESIGRAASRGCIRMHNADVAEVFDMLQVGSIVEIRE